MASNLDLIHIHFPILLLQLLIRKLHRIHTHHHISQILRREHRALHVERLLRELVELRFVQLFLLQQAQAPSLECSFGRAGVRPEFGELVFVGEKFTVEFADSDFDGGDADVGLVCVCSKCGLWVKGIGENLLEIWFGLFARRVSKKAVHGCVVYQGCGGQLCFYLIELHFPATF